MATINLDGNETVLYGPGFQTSVISPGLGAAQHPILVITDPGAGDILVYENGAFLNQAALPATANGALNNAQWLTARNAANTANINIIRITSTNQLAIGAATETTPVAGSVAGIVGEHNMGSATPSPGMAGLWAGISRLGFVFSRRETAAGGVAPTTPLTAHLEMAETGSDGVGMLMHANATVNNARVWGANIISRSEVVTGVKLVGLEVDLQPAVGATLSSDSAGIYINCYSIDGVGPAIQLGAEGGGRWSNGIIIDHISAGGSGFSVNTGAPSMASAINTTGGTYGTAGVVLGAVNNIPSALIRQTSVGAPTAAIVQVQNSDGTVSYFTVDATGNTIFRAKAATDLAVVYDTTTAARVAQVVLRDAGTDKWYIRKPADNTFDIYGSAAGGAALSVATNNTVTFNPGGLPAADVVASGDTDVNLVFVDASTDRVGIGTATPAVKLDVNSDVLRLRTAKTPASAAAAGNQGDIAWDATYIYVCIATNTWRRVAHATW